MLGRTKLRYAFVGCFVAFLFGTSTPGSAQPQGVPSPLVSISPRPLPSSQPATLEPKQIRLVRRVYAELRAGKSDATLFDARMNELLDPTSLASIKASLAPYGTPSVITSTSEEITPTYKLVDYTFEFSRGRSLSIRFSFDPNGKIGALFFPENFH
uniref:DUF3887 domain-containing protein n=1 Tax=mine drainage metagenome TaxID=410659 RepID=E6Q4M6_9ZZZZ